MDTLTCVKSRLTVSRLSSVKIAASQRALLQTSAVDKEDADAHSDHGDDVLLCNSSSDTSFSCQLPGN